MIGERDAERGMRNDPWIAGDVGDRVAAGDEVATLQAPVEHAEQARRLGAVALDRIRHRLARVGTEVAVLRAHRSEPADLPELPLDRFEPCARLARNQLAGLV